MIGPLDAPGGTVADTCVGESAVKVATVPANVTEIAPVRLVPVIVIFCPMGPLSGVKPVIVGGGTTVKALALVAVPPGVVMLIGPVGAPLGTVTVTCTAESTVKAVAVVVPKFTAVAPVRLEPDTVTCCPTGPASGVKLLIVGGGMMVKLVLLVAVPPAVTTVIAPVDASSGTVAVICVAESTVNTVAAVPAKVTDVVPVRLVPVMTTC